MLGDIVPTNNNPNGARPVAKPGQPPRPAVGGYGTSNFGEPKPSAAPATAPRPFRPRPLTPAPAMTQQQPARPVAQPQPQQAAQVQPQPVAQSQSAPAAEPVLQSKPVSLPSTKKSGGKVPLILMIVGIVIFVGGVVALFAYALSGQ